MTDIFDAEIRCPKDKNLMKQTVLNKDGVQLRAVECPKCKEKIIHPADLNCLNHFKDLKGKTYSVKLRMVGNSHAISIPKEIINIFNEQQKIMSEQHKRMKKEMNEMVRLVFEDFGKLSLKFVDEEENEEE